MQYARELAAYTMRQWNTMREALERERSLEASTVPHTQTIRPRSHSQPQDGVGMCLFFLRLRPVRLILLPQQSERLPKPSLSTAFNNNLTIERPNRYFRLSPYFRCAVSLLHTVLALSFHYDTIFSPIAPPKPHFTIYISSFRLSIPMCLISCAKSVIPCEISLSDGAPPCL